MFVDTNLLFSQHLFLLLVELRGRDPQLGGQLCACACLSFVLYGFALGLCEGVCVYIHDILCMTMLIVTTVVATLPLVSR